MKPKEHIKAKRQRSQIRRRKVLAPPACHPSAFRLWLGIANKAERTKSRKEERQKGRKQERRKERKKNKERQKERKPNRRKAGKKCRKQ